MPVIPISIRRLSTHIGRPSSPNEMVDILESLGCDVEDTGQVTLHDCPACGTPAEVEQGGEPPRRCGYCDHEGEAPFPVTGQDEVVRLSLLPDRPDLFDPGGLARAVKGLLEIELGLPRIDVAPGELRVRVDPALSLPTSFRPHIACAEVRLPGGGLGHDGLRDLMKLQENLHWAIGRDRKLASIGVYDLATLRPPVDYRAVGPDELAFVPLGLPGRRLTPRQVLAEHPKGQAYAGLLARHERYPLLVDSSGQVLSLPPIINSEETRVRVGTRALFADVTGTTRADVERALSVLVASLAEMGGTVKSVRIAGPDGERTTPDLAPRAVRISRGATNRWLGLDLSPPELVRRLERMRLAVEGGPEEYTVRYGAWRSDVKHPVDIVADVAVGHGYRNFVPALVPTVTVGRERPEERLSGRARAALLGMGFDEVVSLYQQTEKNHYRRLLVAPGEDDVRLANPKSAELDRVRTHLLSGLLEILEKNRRKAAPLRLFEIGNAVLVDPETETGAREVRRAAFAAMGPQAGYAELRAVMDGLLAEMGWTATYRALEHPTFVPGRAAALDAGEGREGRLGELHPEAIEAWGLPYPVALAELDLMRVF